jgi:hypothetical protein
MIKFHDATSGKPITLSHYVNEHSMAAVTRFSDWLGSLSSHVPTLATSGNLALVFPILLILLVLALLSILYVFRIFLKV